MLRGATTGFELDPEIGTHRPHTPHSRHPEVVSEHPAAAAAEVPTFVLDQETLNQKALTQETSSSPVACLSVNSIDRNTITTPNSRQRQQQHQPQPQHQHQRQLPASDFIARRSSAHSLPPSRGYSTTRYSQDMALTGDKRVRNSPARVIESAPSGRSTPTRELDTASLPTRSRTPVDITPKSTAPSRLGFFFSSRAATSNQAPARTGDDLCDLDIEAALFPAQTSLDGDAFSPAAYKNLQTNATGLLHRMQDAYRQRTIALREIQAEREAQREEMEEMELRTRHFKSQLEAMAAKAAEQEEEMQRLVAELQAEKRAGREKMMLRVAAASSPSSEECSIVGHEDLCIDEEDRKRWRASQSTVKTDLSTDTDADSTAESESIFSRSRSPTAMTCVTESESCLDVPPTLHPRAAAAVLPLKPKPAPQPAQQLTAFQRLVKGMKSTENPSSPGGADGCRNCKGQDSSAAWNTVSLLRDENIALKQRVAALDVVVDGALDIVNGIKI